jgi:hypothetical protein
MNIYLYMSINMYKCVRTYNTLLESKITPAVSGMYIRMFIYVCMYIYIYIYIFIYTYIYIYMNMNVNIYINV